MQTAETFSRIPGHSGYCTSRYVTCLAPFARCTLTSYSGHSAQLRLRRQTDVHIPSSERGSNTMPVGKAGILTTKEPASSQSSWPCRSPESYVWSTETPPSALPPNNARITLSRRTPAEHVVDTSFYLPCCLLLLSPKDAYM